MTLQNQFQQQLQQLGGGAAGALSVQSGDRRLTCDVAECGSLAVSFHVLRLQTGELADAPVADLERISAALAKRLTYLMEPISPIETDAQACIVQLRSNPPQKDDDGRSYYELLVRRGGELALSRFRKAAGNAREPIPATVTSEVLLRLIGDFEAVLE